MTQTPSKQYSFCKEGVVKVRSKEVGVFHNNMEGGSDNDMLLNVAAKAASFNVILQVALRVSSFILNGFVLRYVAPSLLGVVNMRLTLLYNTILFISREPLRKAALSRVSISLHYQYISNLLWLGVPVGVVSGMILSLLWVSPLLQQPDVPWDWVGVAIYFISALLELSVEPLWVLAQNYHYVSIKVIAESTSQVIRCVIIAVGVVTISHGYELLVFAMGQLVYSMVYVVIYYGYFTRELQTKGNDNALPISSITQILPAPITNQYQSPVLLKLSWSFFKQSFLKQLLTDGERYVMTFFGVLSFAEQGVYDIINNLGSLVARFLFLPIEESFYIFFAHILVRGEKSTDQNKDSVLTASTTLSLLLKLVLLIGLVIVVFGYNYSHLALDIYGGYTLSGGSGPLLLQWYCLYVVFLAVNGITECFVFASMSQTQVDRYNRVMLLFSIVFLVAAFILTKSYHSVGFILANCVNMSVRIIHSCHYIFHFFSAISINPFISSQPSLTCIFALITSFIITRASETMFCCEFGVVYRLLHIAVGAVCLIIVGVAILLTEHKLCLFLINRLPSKVQTMVRPVLQTLKYSDKHE